MRMTIRTMARSCMRRWYSVACGLALGCERRLRPDRPQQVDAGAEPSRRQRVAWPEVVIGGSGSEDEQHRAPRYPARPDARREAHPARAGPYADPSEYHRSMQDLAIVLIVILVLVLLWRGPKTLPKLGEALGRGVREARSEAGKAQAEIQARAAGEPTPPDDASNSDRPA